MSTQAATIYGLAVLSLAGGVPVAASVGARWYAVPLCPLAGAVVAALAANASLTFGGSLLAWFVVVAVVTAAIAGAIRMVGRRRPAPGGSPAEPGAARFRWRLVGVAGFVGVAAACAWSLRGLKTPTVGFDARSLWLMRPGWFLQGHAQLLIDLKIRELVLSQSAYPPLVSAAVAVVWRVTGVHSVRLGVTTMAVLNACALAAAALAVVECGRVAARRVASGGGRPDERLPWAPMVTGVAAGVLLVFVAAGITEPFLTNGYADPIWSLAAVGAVAFGLQNAPGRSTSAAAVVLVLVAGLSKNEGLLTACALVALLAFRSVGREGLRLSTPEGRRRWIAPVALAAAELAVLAWWPLLMHAVGARGASTPFTLSGQVASRTSAVAHGMSPYLHILVLALPMAVVGGLVLGRIRRRDGIGHDLWAWLALGVGLVAVGGALVTGQGAILPWIRTTVHRITEYPALEGWWIVAVWAVVAASGLFRPSVDVPA